MKKTMSQKQIDANRRNARKSTGPRTQAGKAASKLNSLKHGILSSEVVVRGLTGCESTGDFDALRQRFWQELAPVGPVEEMLLDRIVTSFWRLRRAMKAEAGEIALNVDGGHWERTRPCRMYHPIKMAALFPTGDTSRRLEESTTGLHCLMGMLQRVRAAVEKAGELTDAALQETHFAGKPNGLTNELAELRTVPLHDAEGLDETALKAGRREQILTAINRRLEQYRWLERQATEREEAEESARQAAAVLPSPETLDKIMRYETTLERCLYRAMSELERHQRRRQGEAVPPPLSMEVSQR